MTTHLCGVVDYVFEELAGAYTFESGVASALRVFAAVYAGR